jgi:imidazoleglycerol-phosphate dehydratase/histidinol-phosphatase
MNHLRMKHKKVLFIDRDGTLVAEPEDYQLDAVEKLEFVPKVFRNLYLICKNLDYELVMVTNQDGLGTSTFPEKEFHAVHHKILQAFKNEGITFHNIHIDPSLPGEQSPNRKPGTGMLRQYMEGNYDLSNSYVIGDRLTDIKLAKNLGAKGILLNDGSLGDELQQKGLDKVCVKVTNDWDEIYAQLAERSVTVKRTTRETDILIELSLDNNRGVEIKTGLSFFDHMLEQIALHARCNLRIFVKGDLNIDEHHTIEDTALALGQAFKKAIGDKRGIERYGYCLPMDDCLAQVAVDFGGRPWIVWEADFKREKIGDMPTEMFFHFFKSFSDASLSNLHIEAKGENEHHKIEAIFKAFAKAIKMAVKREPFHFTLPSTKGRL